MARQEDRNLRPRGTLRSSAPPQTSCAAAFPHPCIKLSERCFRRHSQHQRRRQRRPRQHCRRLAGCRRVLGRICRRVRQNLFDLMHKESGCWVPARIVQRVERNERGKNLPQSRDLSGAEPRGLIVSQHPVNHLLIGKTLSIVVPGDCIPYPLRDSGGPSKAAFRQVFDHPEVRLKASKALQHLMDQVIRFSHIKFRHGGIGIAPGRSNCRERSAHSLQVAASQIIDIIPRGIYALDEHLPRLFFGVLRGGLGKIAVTIPRHERHGFRVFPSRRVRQP